MEETRAPNQLIRLGRSIEIVDEMTQLPRSVFDPQPELPIWDDEDEDENEGNAASGRNTVIQEAARDRLDMSPLDEHISTLHSNTPSCVIPVQSTSSRTTHNLVAATNTSQAPLNGSGAHPQSSELITFWPELQIHLEHPSLPTPELRCMICLDTLLVRGLGQHMEAGASWEKCCVLPCGHLIGMGCLEGHIGSYQRGSSGAWTRAGSDSPMCPRCPMCRLDLVFRDCGDVVWGVVLPATADDEFGFDVPPVVKSSADIEKDCGRCRMKKTQSLLDGLLGHMFNGDETMPGFMALREEQRLRILVEEINARICQGPSWARFDR